MLKEIALVFFRLGVIGFGGPATHIAMMEDEVVHRRKWITHEHFLDLLGLTNLIPGPNSTEMAIQIGFIKSGWRGLVVAGVCFIFPATVITLGFAYLYVSYGSLPRILTFIAGIRPAIVAIIGCALYRLAKPLSRNSFAVVTLILIALMSYVGVDEVVLLLAGGVGGIVWFNRKRISAIFPLLCFLGSASTVALPISVAPLAQNAPTLISIGLFFLKVGSVLYGSGYVLVAFLQGGLVDARHWLTQKQLFDAIAVGQLTPGPVLSTATFIGFVLFGVQGAIVATVGIFLPSFVLVAGLSPLLSRIRALPSARGFLDGVNAAALGLMLAVCVSLGRSTLLDPASALIFVAAGALMLARDLHPAWIVLGSALAGWLLSFL